MPNRDSIIKTEREEIARFFNVESPQVPDLQDWVDDGLIQYWNDHLFHVHYLPRVSLDENMDVPLWRERPSEQFYKKIREGKIREEAKNLPGTWILIDARDKPTKKVPWIRKTDVWLFEKLGFHPKTYLKKWSAQSHQREYINAVLKERGFGSRFCLSLSEIDELKPFILEFLKIDKSKTIRLPHFIEYNYLGNAFYPQWGTTKTWEWFEDIFDDSQHLAGGSGSVRAIGWDPPDYWSTILTFRPVIEL